MLHVLCMDDIVFDALDRLNLDNIQLIRLNDFEDDELRKAKRDRSIAEYCWTCTPSLPLYVLGKDPSIELITYLDADLYFFNSPEPVFGEFGDKSILIIEHRFMDRLKHLVVNGKYNVEMVSFRNDENGRSCLRWWRERCNEWCYNRLEDGKLGDQKYLDDWPTRFAGVHVLRHLGAGVAPWNFSLYEMRKRGDRIFVDQFPLIFYHFHQLRILKGGRFYFMSNMYNVEQAAPVLIYELYTQCIDRMIMRVRAVDPEYRHGIHSRLPIMLRAVARKCLPVPMKNTVKKYFGKRLDRFA